MRLTHEQIKEGMMAPWWMGHCWQRGAIYGEATFVLLPFNKLVDLWLIVYWWLSQGLRTATADALAAEYRRGYRDGAVAQKIKMLADLEEFRKHPFGDR